MQQSLQTLKPTFCKLCDKPIRLNVNGNVTCSKKCAHIYARIPHTVQVRHCKRCGVEMKRKKVESYISYAYRKYCSDKCYIRPKVGHRFVALIVHCDCCGSEIQRGGSRRSYYSRKFCSKLCMRKAKVLG